MLRQNKLEQPGTHKPAGEVEFVAFAVGDLDVGRGDGGDEPPSRFRFHVHSRQRRILVGRYGKRDRVTARIFIMMEHSLPFGGSSVAEIPEETGTHKRLFFKPERLAFEYRIGPDDDQLIRSRIREYPRLNGK